jgi:fatty acid CoA ligase FadD9
VTIAPFIIPEERQERRLAELVATDRQVREALERPEIADALRDPALPLTGLVSLVMTAYADRPALGERGRELVTDPATGRGTLVLAPRYDTITYAELWTRVGAVAAEWHSHEQAPVRAGGFVGVLGAGSIDFTVADLACVRLGAASVPLQASATAANLTPIIDETEQRVLAVSVELLDVGVDCALAAPTLRRLIVLDYHPEVDDEREKLEAARARLADRHVTVDTLAVVLERGASLPPAPEFIAENPDEHVSLLIYTSGSTGTPKGAIYTDRLVANEWLDLLPRYPGLPRIGVNYLPLSHMMGRGTLYTTLASGGTAHFAASSDLSTLFEDLSLVRPTELVLVPRVCDALFQHYTREVDRRTGDRAAREAEVKQEIRERLLGGRVVWSGSGSAPLSPEIAAFMESCVDSPAHDVYGSTEAGIVLMDRKPVRPPLREYKLEDVAELGYFTTDTPHPRGELVLKSDVLFPGYYKRPEVTADVFDADGYYRTGDVMAEVAPGELVYVDRRSNVLKLAQGEFVAVSRLEALFVGSPLIRQIYLYGSSERSHLLAVIVPTADGLETGRATEGALRESLRRIAREAGLNSYEVPRDFLVETEPFSAANGLLSEVRKLLRPKLKSFYGERLEQLYRDLAERESQELAALRDAGRQRPVLETVLRAARAVLNTVGDVPADAHFLEFGGDSLSALTFANLLRDIFDIEIPVDLLLSSANTLQRVADHIETTLDSGATRPTATSIHGAGTTSVRAADLTLSAFLDPETLAAAHDLPKPDGTVKTVLLTGANGYLGRFLCLGWLERLSERDGKLICIVRGTDADAARARLSAVFDSGDPELLRRFHHLAENHLEVLAGDIGEAGLGLDGQTWQRLADTVDLIVHPAALVNHVLPYDQLFGPNVVGTAELIRMALTAKVKPLTYLSTVAVLGADISTADEDSDIRSSSPHRVLDDGYANGYATSKWAGEVLLREAHDAYGLPVAVFRSDLILAHSRYTGQVNVTDMFTRLVLSLLATGIAPGSFYRSDSARAHYDGLPADFTAEAIATLGEQTTRGYHTYNALNPHDDGISLDTVVDWLVAEGVPITRVADYHGWLARFESKLRALPDRQRQNSLLPLLHAYREPAEAIPGAGLPTDRFRAAVQAAKIGSDKDIPHLSQALIRKYVNDLKALGLS